MEETSHEHKKQISFATRDNWSHELCIVVYITIRVEITLKGVSCHGIKPLQEMEYVLECSETRLANPVHIDEKKNSLNWQPKECYNYILLKVGFNRCPLQLLRSYKRHEESKNKIGQERSSMQQADYQCHRPTPWMQESVSMHKSPTPVRQSRMNQARSAEEGKERKRDRKDRGQEDDGKKGSPAEQKTHLRN